MMNVYSDIKDSSKIQDCVLSVIIPFYGDKQELFKCLKGIHLQNFNKPYELIIVESGNDPQVKQTLEFFPNSFLISSSTLLNRAKARNAGAKKAHSDFLVFLDADCVPLPNWLSEAYSSFKNNSEIVVGTIINLYPFHPIASVDNLLQFTDFQKHSSSKNISHFSGTNFGITKKLFKETGGYCEELTLGEDIKFSQSAIRKCEGKIYFNSAMIVKHAGRKNYMEFFEHNKAFGFYRGYLNLKIPSSENKLKRLRLYPIYFGIKRFIYISVRTIQWNPVGVIRIIFYFPIVILGLSAWTNGFRKGLNESK